MENEMIADIVAEKRRLADEWEKSLGDQHSCVETLRFDADRIEAAWKREKSQSWHHREMEELILQHEKEVAELKKLIPQPDPDWKAICEKCHDGEIEPKCEYYGEPNGCNSPIYGEHPTAENSSAVGNAARLREAVALALTLLDLKEGVPYKTVSQKDIDFIKAALAEPMRNCDVGTPKEQEDRWKTNCGYGIPNCKHCKVYEEAKNSGLVNGRYLMRCDCRFIWAQMPYEEGVPNAE